MDDRSYEELKLYDENGKEVISEERLAELDAWFETTDAWLDRLQPIEPALERFRGGGKYAAIAFDPVDGKVIFINHDGTRIARTPEQIERLLTIRRPHRPILQMVR